MRCAALLMVLASGCWLEQEDFKNKRNPSFHVIGHRGAPNEAAENTIESMRRAVAAGANAVEIDVCVTRDARVVLWHDEDPDEAVALARQNGLEGFAWVPRVPPSGDPLRRPVHELDIADFLASHGYARGGALDTSAEIAQLSGLLEWAAGATELRAIYVDVKVSSPEHAGMIVRAFAAGWMGRDVDFVYLSPRSDVVVALRDAVAELPDVSMRVARDFESGGALAATERLGLRDVSVGLTPVRSEADLLDEVETLLDARQDKRIHTVTVWTIDRRMQLGVLLYYGVDGIITNEPARLAELWQATL